MSYTLKSNVNWYSLHRENKIIEIFHSWDDAERVLGLYIVRLGLTKVGSKWQGQSGVDYWLS